LAPHEAALLEFLDNDSNTGGNYWSEKKLYNESGSSVLKVNDTSGLWGVVTHCYHTNINTYPTLP